MPTELKDFLEAVISIFAIVNPIGNLPVFAGLTEGASPAARRRVLRLGGIVALCIICVMAVMGQFILDRVFHIRMEEFAFGGGLLLVVIGIRSMVSGMDRPAGRNSTDAETQLGEGVTIAVTPIASPLLVGPGSIVTVMLMVSSHGVIYGLAASVVAFAFVMLVLNWSHQAFRLMGRIGSLAVGRVMQIFIISIGVHFMFRAVETLFPALFR